MSLRIGYVNVRGLSTASWEACHRLLSARFDYLFIAETWFVNHRVYAQDRRFIASTTQGTANLQGRPRGGIYLVGSCQARSEVRRFHVTEHSITFTCGRSTISGVYFPPSTLDLNTLSAYLEALRSSTVIVGDINTRFRDRLCQAGEPGPLERLQVFVDFLTQTDFQHIKPAPGPERLTTDHCFVRAGRPAALALLPTAGHKIHTDHKYIVGLTLGHAGAAPAPDLGHVVKRFRVVRLGKKALVEKLCGLIDGAGSPFAATDNVDEMNAKLTRFCQEVQEQTIGLASPRRAGLSPVPTTREQTVRASVRLYKSACQASEENNVIFPTPEAASRGVTAVEENLAVFRERWQGRPFLAPQEGGDAEELGPWRWEDVYDEIREQASERSCGADGIHIRFLKAVRETQVVWWLLQLYNRCLSRGRVPRVWAESDIHLITKDLGKRRDANNLRPISIIYIFRKIFERLLLLRVEGQRWARLHPAQAGFRHDCSTYGNAAVVHMLLASKTRSTAVFLDFRSAFDVVDHYKLDAKLAQRGCPRAVRALLQDLMFCNLRSRVLINGQVTDWLPRSRGVLQGSPLSPWLFNIFVDDLLDQVNADAPTISLCLFYADDGAILPTAQTDLAMLLRIVEA